MINADRYRHTGRTYVNIFGARRKPHLTSSRMTL
jgi:hypothetical protein